MNKKWKSSTFLLTLTGAVVVMINTIGKSIGFSVDAMEITSIVTSIIGVLITLGIVNKDDSKNSDKSEDKDDSNSENEQNLEQENKDNTTKLEE